MPTSAILFRFSDVQSAGLAFDTLQELGYEPVLHTEETPCQVHIHVDHSNLASALEIAQAHGGTLVEESGITPVDSLQNAYQLDAIPIPAHIVNEDWSEDYAQSAHAALANRDDDDEAPNKGEGEIPAFEGSFDYMSGDVRI